MNVSTIKELILIQVETIAHDAGYDMVYENNEADELLIQIILRDYEGSIIGTPLSLDLKINEEKGVGEAIFYHSRGEFKRMNFDILKDGSIVEMLLFINNRLNAYR